jgi:hypothetical protein
VSRQKIDHRSSVYAFLFLQPLSTLRPTVALCFSTFKTVINSPNTLSTPVWIFLPHQPDPVFGVNHLHLIFFSSKTVFHQPLNPPSKRRRLRSGTPHLYSRKLLSLQWPPSLRPRPLWKLSEKCCREGSIHWSTSRGLMKGKPTRVTLIACLMMLTYTPRNHYWLNTVLISPYDLNRVYKNDAMKQRSAFFVDLSAYKHPI